ncbi:hypothetical protein ABZW02_35335, partial [Streptomyces sp. NPDC005180]
KRTRPVAPGAAGLLTSFPDGSRYRPPKGLDERGLLGAVVSAEAYAYTHGPGVCVDLGAAGAIPVAPPHTYTVRGSPATTPARGRAP